MKKLINATDDGLAESLDGFAAAHADIVTLGDERKFVRRANAEARQGRAGIRRRLRAMSRFMPALSVTACSTPPVPARSSPRRRPTR